MSSPSTRDPPRSRSASQRGPMQLRGGAPDDVFTAQRHNGTVDWAAEPALFQQTNPSSPTPRATFATPQLPTRNRATHQAPGPSPLRYASSPSNQHTPRPRASQPPTTAALSHILTNHLQSTRSRHAGKKTGQKLPQGTIMIDEGDWNTLTSLIDQLTSSTQRDSQLLEKIATLSNNIVSLQASFDSRLTSIEENIAETTTPTNLPRPLYSDAVKLTPHPATATQPSHARNPRPGRNPELELTLVQTNPSQPVFSTTLFPELKAKIERILASAGIEKDTGEPIAIRTISRHPSKDLIIALHSKEDARTLRSSAPTWIPALSPQLSLRRTLYPVICHRIPVDFEPTTAEGIAELKAAAAGGLESLEKAVWANPKKLSPEKGPPKVNSSIIIYLANPIEANNIIRFGLPFRATQHPAEKSRRSLIQCHKCQHFGHTAVRCSSPPACGRCAAPT